MASDEPLFLKRGDRLCDRYLVGEELGRGGLSVIYGADDLLEGRKVAIKVLVPPPALLRTARERLRREAQAVRAVSHPRIVPILAILEDEGPFPMLVLGHVAGGDLQAAVARRGSLPAEEVQRIGADIAGALAAAHAAGILHRDVKPQNVLLDDAGALLTDFGAARMDGQSTLTATGALVGTLDYAAPELLRGARADARSDVYALGLTLYFALCGALPPRPSPHQPPPALPGGHRPPQGPPWLAAILSRATAAAPAQRFPTAEALAEALSQGPGSDAAAALGRPEGAFCAGCGGPAPLGPFCAQCEATPVPMADEALVVMEPGALGRRRTAAALRALALVPERALAEVAAGERALSLSTCKQAGLVVERLHQAGVRAQVVPRAQAQRGLPRPFLALCGAVLLAGVWAGSDGNLAALCTAPLMAGGLLWLGRKQLAEPALVRRGIATWLPAAARGKVEAALGALAEGAARELLLDLCALAHALGSGALLAAHGDLRGPLAELVALGADAAREIQRMDEALLRLEGQRGRFAQLPASFEEASSACERARDAMVQRVLEALASLGRLCAQTSLAPDGVGASLSQRTKALREETALRLSALAEVEAALAPVQQAS